MLKIVPKRICVLNFHTIHAEPYNLRAVKLTKEIMKLCAPQDLENLLSLFSLILKLIRKFSYQLASYNKVMYVKKINLV